MRIRRTPPSIEVLPGLNACCLRATIDHTANTLPIEQLIHHLFSHFPDPVVNILDPGHGNFTTNDLRIRDLNPFCNTIRYFVSDIVIQDPEPFENVFKVYHSPCGNIQAIAAAVHSIQDMDSVPSRVLQENTRESLGQLAIQDGRADVLEWCLKQDGGLRFEADFQIAANKVREDENPQMYAVLDKYCFSSNAWNHHWRT